MLSSMQGDCTQRSSKASIAFTHKRLLVIEQGVLLTLRLRCEGVEAVNLTWTDSKTYTSWHGAPSARPSCARRRLGLRRRWAPNEDTPTTHIFGAPAVPGSPRLCIHSFSSPKKNHAAPAPSPAAAPGSLHAAAAPLRPPPRPIVPQVERARHRKERSRAGRPLPLLLERAEGHSAVRLLRHHRAQRATQRG